MSNYTDELEIASKVINGSHSAFLEFVNDYKRLVYHVIVRMIPNRSDHEDLGQDIFLKLFKKLHTFKGDSKLSTWIAKISYNTCLNYLEKKKVPLLDDKLIPSEGDTEKDSLIDTFEGEYMLPDEITESRITAEMIQEEISKLPPTFKVILTLYHIEEMKYKEISEITNLPEGTVKSYLFRARKALKENISKEFKMEDLCL